jgi:hypothetical protein
MAEIVKKSELKKHNFDKLLGKELERLAKIKEYKTDEIDRLEEYARCRVHVMILRAKVEAEGEVFTSSKGGSYLNPRVSILLGVLTRMDKLRDKLYPPKPNAELKRADIRDEFI